MAGISELPSETILVVEDNALLALDAASSVTAAGFDVVMTGRGGEALTLLESRRFRAAILDYQVQDGTILKVIRRLNDGKIPFRIVSGMAPGLIEREGIPPGVIRSKPLSYDQVVDDLVASTRLM
ncbi:response regulator [Rhizobium halophytocola]|uniref:CheY-like chemotaxis protein n=1 Tax=Rhizobium halophytocola TaxID=735519 RepID=A0ABS4DX63_9HYPH|nr:response regulator [Rhizobium halophytocola]MBP1850257.1 CheY-like chemotaxis protein [Rhizobium halophytocola]